MLNGCQAERQTGSASKAVDKEQGPCHWSRNLVPGGKTGQRTVRILVEVRMIVNAPGRNLGDNNQGRNLAWGLAARWANSL